MLPLIHCLDIPWLSISETKKVYLSMVAAEQLSWKIWTEGSLEVISKQKKQKLSTCFPPFLSPIFNIFTFPDDSNRPTNVNLDGSRPCATLQETGSISFSYYETGNKSKDKTPATRDRQ